MADLRARLGEACIDNCGSIYFSSKCFSNSLGETCCQSFEAESSRAKILNKSLEDAFESIPIFLIGKVEDEFFYEISVIKVLPSKLWPAVPTNLNEKFRNEYF